MKIPIGNYCGYSTTIGEKCGYSTTLGKYAWILSYYWGICGYSAGIEPKIPPKKVLLIIKKKIEFFWHAM